MTSAALRSIVAFSSTMRSPPPLPRRAASRETRAASSRSLIELSTKSAAPSSSASTFSTTSGRLLTQQEEWAVLAPESPEQRDAGAGVAVDLDDGHVEVGRGKQRLGLPEAARQSHFEAAPLEIGPGRSLAFTELADERDNRSCHHG